MTPIWNEPNALALVRRTLRDDDSIIQILCVVITDVPDTADLAAVKDTLDALGSTIMDGVRRDVLYEDEGLDWSQGYKLIASGDWNHDLNSQVTNVMLRVELTDEDLNGHPVAEASSGPGMIVRPGDDSYVCCRVVSYSELESYLTGEVRVTLRMPRILHSRLARHLDEIRVKSLNSYCVKVLADSIGFKDELAGVESQKRKPGRPRKSI